MEYTKKIPAEAVDLYTRYIHGEVSRRDFLESVKRYAVGGLTATAIVEALMPNYALGQQVRKDDERIKASYETVPSPNGHGYIKGYFVRPFSADTRTETPAKLPGVIIVHENRGLNPHTEDVARRFALENFNAFAPDALSSIGGYPGDDYKGGQLFAKIDAAKRTPGFRRRRAVVESAPRWQRENLRDRFLLRRRHVQYPGCPAGRRIGGGRAVLWRRDRGRKTCPKSRRRYSSTTARSIRHWCNAYPAQEAELKKNNIRYEGHIYPNSVHGFFNDATPERYNKVTAEQAWTRTIEWFNKYARG